jgi:hypothetical protein
MKRFILFVAAIFIFVFTFHPGTALADIAPEPPASGSDLAPSIANTNVQMVSEYVLIDIAGYSENPLGEAQVTAQFFMRNMGDVTEQMKVRFPLNHSEYHIEAELESGEEFCIYMGTPFIDEITVWVNDEKADTSITYKILLDPIASGPENGNVYIDVPCWAHFDVVFPPAQDVGIKVSYTVFGYDPSSRFGEDGSTQYFYVLGTGAGWYDTIGQADIVARLPYDITNLNFWYCQPEDCVISGKEIAWHFEDFEPQGNIAIEIMKPSIWLRILTETENIRANANDGEAWGRLAKAYKDSIENGKGILDVTHVAQENEIYLLSKEAYQKATNLLPNDADWHFGFADLLCRYAEWNEAIREDWVACVEQLKFALDIAPNHERANELLQHLYFIQDFHYLSPGEKFIDLAGPEPVYLILTVQPTATYTQPIPTKTPTPQITLTNTPESSSTPTSISSPLNTNTPQVILPAATVESPSEDVSQTVETNSSPTIYFLVGTTLVFGLILWMAAKQKNDS